VKRAMQAGGTLVVVVVAWTLTAVSGAAPADSELAEWIGQLADPQFARREAASKSLLAAGLPAVDPLATAIQGGDLEVASRGVEILRAMLADETLAEAAEAALERCAEEGDAAAARLAAAALDFHVLGMAAAARARLESLGAVVRELPVASQGAIEVELGRDWKGTSTDLRELPRLARLEGVSFHGVRLDEPALAVIGRLRGLERLELFGTGLGEEAIAALAAKLPETQIDIRQGGKLGVGALAFGGPCEIQTVEPGSAADQAGVRPGDVVVAIDGLPIVDFDGLTRRVAGRGPGDIVRLTVTRRDRAADGDPERLDFEVRLDAW
jgi:hypothetical protein